jgi:UDP-N-acetylmuramate dehydrogenase
VTSTTRLDELAQKLGDRATRQRPLGPLTTYGVGGPAALFVEVEDEAALQLLRTELAGTDVSLFVMGRGSNLLVADAGFDGVVVRLGSGFASIELPPSGSPSPVVRAGAAVALPVLARRVAEGGWTGLSWAVGVPGSLGGAVRMNAGGHGSDMAACLDRYGWVDLRSEAGGTGDVTRLDYGYRTSSVARTELVLWAELRVTTGEVAAEQAELRSIVAWRRAHQPGGSNAGSVFTNPPGDSAGRLIEAAGLKGFRLGTAQVSEKHANFIQADKGGRADDVRALMDHVRSGVEERCGVRLEAEVRQLGFGEGETEGVAPRVDDSR